MLPLLAYAAYQESHGPTSWEEFIGTDWGTDTAQNTTEGAYQSYAQHLRDMRDKQGWPASMVQSMIGAAAVVESNASSPASFWSAIGDKEPGWMRAANVEPGSLAKYESHISFLQASGASTEALERAKAEYSPISVLTEVTKTTAEKIGDTLNPKKSPWPWVAAGVVALLLFRR